jgi:cyanate lyase
MTSLPDSARAVLEDPAGDRVVVTLDGKFLPYQW